MAVIGTTGVDNITLLISEANETVDLLASTDTLNLPNVVTNLLVSNTEVINGGTAADTVTLQTAIASGSKFSLGTSNDTLAFTGTGFDLRSATLTSVETLKAGTTSATTFTVDTADLASGGSVLGSSSNDTLAVNSTSFNLSSTVLSSVEILKSGVTTATTFTVEQADLVSGGSVLGSTGTDTLTISETSLDLSSTALSSIERITAGNKNATTFTVDAADLAASGSVIGSSGNDTLIINGTSFNLVSTTLSSVERLTADSASDTTFTVDATDLVSGGSVLGSTGSDTLTINGTSFNLTNTTLSSVETLQAGKSSATTFTVDTADLASGGSVTGSSGNDTLTINSVTADLRSTTLTSVETIRAGKNTATTFTVDTTDLLSGGSVIGSSGNDTLTINSTSFDLRSTALSSLEIIKAGTASATTFTLDSGDIISGGTIVGSTGSDTLSINGTSLNLISTSLSSVETLKSGTSNATTFTIDEADLANGGSIVGGSSVDTLILNDVDIDLRSTTLSNIEILRSNKSADLDFDINQADLVSGGSVFGSTGSDELRTADTQLDLRSTTISSIETLRANTTGNTTISIDQSDLASGGTVRGNSGTDTLVIAGTSLDLRSTTVSSLERIQAGVSNATTFTVDTADLVSGGTVTGSTGNDTLTINSTTFSLANTTLSSVEILQAFKNSATTFTVDAADLAAGGSVVGSTGSDTLTVNGTSFDLSSTTLSSVEKLTAVAGTAMTFSVDQADLASNGTITGTTKDDTLVAAGTGLDLSSTALSSINTIKAGSVSATTFTVNATDLFSGGTVTGSTGTDTLTAADIALNLISTTVSSIEILKAGSTSATTFTVDTTDLAKGGSVIGNNGNDTLTINSTSFDLSSTALSSVERLVAGKSSATTFTVDAADMISGGSVLGSTGNDTLLLSGTSVDVSSTALSSVEILKAGTANATTFTVDTADLSANGSVLGSTGTDALEAGGTSLDLTSTTLSNVEILDVGTTSATTLTVDAADLVSGGSVLGNSGADTLKLNTASFDLRSTIASSIEVLQAGKNTATTFNIDAADLAANGSILGSSGNDTLTVGGTAFDVSSTTLSSVEILKGATASATTFTVDTVDLASGGSVLGSTGNDTLAAGGASLDLTSTTLSSVEALKVSFTGDTTFTVDAADLVSGGSVFGNSGDDILSVKSTSFNLSSTTLSSIDVLKAGVASGTSFTLDATDLAANGSVLGNSGTDTLTIVNTSFDLGNTTVSSVEVLKAGSASATTFAVDAEDLAAGGSVLGSTGTDTLLADGTSLDLSSTALSSIETLKAGTANATTFRIDTADLTSGGSVLGSTGNDTLIANATSLDTTSATLSSIEVLQAASTAATTFSVDAADVANKGSVLGNSGDDTLSIKSTGFDLSSTTLSSVEVLNAGVTSATTFTADADDLASGGSVLGNSSSDTLTLKSTDFDLSGTTLSSVETLKAGSAGATTFTVDTADLAGNGSVLGSTGNDTLSITGTVLDLSSTTLSSVEALKAGTTDATTFTVDATDLASSGSVLGNTDSDTLTFRSTAANLTSTVLSSVEVLKAGSASATTFTVDTADLAAGGSVLGSSGSDTLSVNSTSFDLSSTTLSSVETLKAGVAGATTFTVDQSDLLSGGTVSGSTGNDTLLTAGTGLDLSNTSVSSIEILKAGTTSATTFTVDTADLASGGSVLGSSGNDTIAVGATSLDTSNTTLSSVEILKANNASATTFVVTSGDLLSGGSVLGNSGADTLTIGGTSLDLRSTTLSSVEALQAGSTGATAFTVDAADLADGGSVFGSSGADTLTIGGTLLDLSGTTLSNVEILKAGTANATTFVADTADLASGGSVLGSSGTDTLVVAGDSLNTSNTTLSSVEILKAGTTFDSTFTVTQGDLASGGSVIGNTGDDTLAAGGTSLDLSSTTLSSVEALKAGTASPTEFTVDSADLAVVNAVQGANGTDTLTIKSTSFDLTGTTLSSVEVLKAGLTGATTFSVDAADLAAGGSVVGSSSTDTLLAGNTTLDLSSTTLSSVESLKAGTTGDTTFTVDSTDLAAGGSVIGSSGTDTLIAAGTALNLNSTTLSSVETLQAGNAGSTTFTVDSADLISGGSVLGSSGSDTLVAAGNALNLASTALSSVETLKAGSTNATTFTVDQGDLAESGTVAGSSGTDTLAAAGTALDLSLTELASVEIVKAGTAGATTLTVDNADLVAGGSVLGSTGTDTLATNGSSLDLSSTTLSNVEILQSANASPTTFVVDQADLTNSGSVVGNAGKDTLTAAGTSIDLGSTALDSIEVIKAGNTGNTTLTVDQGDLVANGTVVGNSGFDTLTVKGTGFDLSGTTLSNVEIIKAGSASATTFTVDSADLTSGGSVLGSSGSDTLAIAADELDLRSTTLSSVETLKAGTTEATSFIVDAADLSAGGSVLGNSGDDTLVATATALDLTSTTLSSVDVLQAGATNSTTFTLDAADLAAGGSVVGDLGSDTLAFKSTSVDLTGTTLSSVEILKAGSTNATSFEVDQADLLAGGSVIGSSGTDTLFAGGTSIDLGNTSLSSVEVLKAGTASATTFTVDTADLASGGSVVGSSGIDTLIAGDSLLDLGSTTLTSVEIVKAGTDDNTSIVVDAADLASGGSVIGGAGSDTLTVKGTSFDLSGTTVSGVETLQAGASGTTFKLDGADLAGVAVSGSTGTDTLLAAGTALDLSGTTLTSVEAIKAGTASATTFTVDQTDLVTGGSVLGSSGSDTLTVAGAEIDLGGTALSSVEALKAGTTGDTTFNVDQADLAAGGSVLGNSGSDVLEALGTTIDLTSTTLSSVELLRAGPDSATTFTVDSGDLATGVDVAGGLGSDTLVVNGTSVDLSSAALTSIDTIKAGSTSATTFKVDQADLISDPAFDGIVQGNSGTDTLIANGTSIDLRSITLSSVEIIKAGTNDDTTFTLDVSDLVKGGQVIGGSGNDTLILNATSLNLNGATLTSIETVKLGATSDTLFVLTDTDLKSKTTILAGSGTDTAQFNGTAFNLTSLTLDGIEIIRAGSGSATTFTVDQADLAKGGVVRGSTGNDTLAIKGSMLDLTSTSLNSVEVLKAGTASNTTFKVNQSDLLPGGTVYGGAGIDTLTTDATSLDLRSTTLTNVEFVKAGSVSDTTFTVDESDLRGRTIAGNSGNDTLVTKGTSVDLSSAALSSVEVIKASSASNTTFFADQADLLKGGTIQGGSGTDSLAANGASIDLTSSTLESVEILKVGKGGGITTFVVDQSDLVAGGSVQGAGGADTLKISGTSFDLTNTTLNSVENIAAGKSTATTFTVNPGDLLAGGAVIGSSGTDTLIVKNASFDVSGTKLTNVEILKAGSSNDTTFIVDQLDLAKNGSVLGSSGSDALSAASTTIDLGSVTLSSVEVLKAGKNLATTFVVDQADLSIGGQVLGSTGNDTLAGRGTVLDLTSTTLNSVETLKANAATATTFKVDQADLASNGVVQGNGGNDTLSINGASLNLSSTTLKSVEIIKAGTTGDTTITVDQSDLAASGTVSGNTGTDTLIVNGTGFSLASTTINSVEILKAGSTAGTTFTVTQTDLVSGGVVQGSAKIDTLAAGASSLNLTATTLSGIEVLRSDIASATTFTVDADDLAAGGSVIGSTGADTLIIKDASFDLTGTTLSGIETIKAGVGTATTFTLDQGDLVGLKSAIGSSGNDTLTVTSTTFDLSSTALSSVEMLKSGTHLATTFTVNQADLLPGGTVAGSTATDTLLIKGSSLDLRSTTLNSVETLKAGTGSATTFTVENSDLATGGMVAGSIGADTLSIVGSNFDLSNTTLSSVEILQSIGSTSTKFTVDMADLAKGGSLAGGSPVDTLIIKDAGFNLSSTTLSSVEVLQAGSTNATTFTIDQVDLAKSGSVVGSAQDDILSASSSALDLRSTTLNSVEIVKAGGSVATTWTVNQADLDTGGSVLGNTGADMLAGASLNLTSTTLSSVEILQASSMLTVDQGDLSAGGSVQGVSGADTLKIAGTSLDLTSTTLTSVETLEAGNGAATTFRIGQTDLAVAGSVKGNSGVDTLAIVGSQLNLSSTTLSGVEIIRAGSNAPTTFTIDQADLAANGSVIGSSASDTLLTSGSALDLRSTTLSSIETIKSTAATPTIFTVDAADISAVAVVGGSGSDTLTVNGAAFDLTSTVLSSIETLKANAANTTFTVDQADLAKGGAVLGSSGTDTLVVNNVTVDLTGTLLSSVESVEAGVATDTTFLVDQLDLAKNGSLSGNSGADTLTIMGTSLDLSSTTLNSIETIKAGSAAATTFGVNGADLVSGGAVVGSSGSDTLLAKDSFLNLTSTSLTSIETIKAGSTGATSFTVDQVDLAASGFVIGSAGNDTLTIAGIGYDLTSTTLSSVEILKGGSTSATTFNVDHADLATSGSVLGGAGTDTLIVKGVVTNLSSTTLSSVEILKASTAGATSFTVNQADLASGGSVIGNAGVDTLIGQNTTLNLSSTTLTGIEVLKTNSAITVFTVDQNDLATGGSVFGGTGSDTLMVIGTSADLTGTTLTSIETLKTSTAADTTFIVKQASLAGKGSVTGSSGEDTLMTLESSLNLASTTLNSVEIIQAGANSSTLISVDQADLAAKGSVLGNGDIDTLAAIGSTLNLTSTTLSSIEVLKAGSASATFITVDQTDLASGGAVIGNTGTDVLFAGGTSLNLTSTSLSSVEIIKAGAATATTFTVDQIDLASKGSVFGSTGNDALVIDGISLNLASTTLSSVEVLKAGATGDTTFTVDMLDLAQKGSVLGSSGNDTLTVSGSAVDLRSTTLSSVEILQTAASTAMTFTVDQVDLAAKGSVLGGNGSDTLTIAGTSLDLTSTTLSSVEVLKAGVAGATTFKVDVADLASPGSVFGSSGSDTLMIAGTSFDLTGITVSSVEILKGDAASATLFTIDMADLAAKGSVLGGSAADTLIVAGTAIDLSSTMLSNVEILKTGSTANTTFTIDQADLMAKGSLIGSSGVDTLVVKGTVLDLTSTSLDSIEIIKTAIAGATVFTVDGGDLASGGSVIGSVQNDTLVFENSDANLTATTLSSIEIIRAGSGTGTKFTVDQGDLASGSSVFGSTGSDSLVAAGTSLDLRSTGLSSIESLKAGNAGDTVFTVDQVDLISGMTVSGSSGVDTLTGAGASLDLRSVTLSSIEILQASATTGATFIVDQSDLAAGSSVMGNIGSDTLKFSGAQIDLTSTTLSSIEIVMASSSLATTFTLDEGAAGLSLIGVTAAADVFRFVGGYGLTNVSDDNSILADTATITNFNTTNSEIIDVSALTSGAVTFQSQATTQAAVNAVDPTVFKDALDAAAAAIDGSTNSIVTSFQYGGATYVLVDNSSGPGVTTDDVVIKLSGNLTLTTSEFLL